MLADTLLLLLLLLSFSSPRWTLSHLDEARTSLWLCGADQLTNDREEGRSEEGIEKREGGILCNGVENTKERQAHAFVIFVFLLTPSLPPSLALVPCLSLLLFSDLNTLCSVSPSGSSDGNKGYINRQKYPFNYCIVKFTTVSIINEIAEDATEQ